MELKEKLVALRKREGLTQLVVAEKLNVFQTSYFTLGIWNGAAIYR